MKIYNCTKVHQKSIVLTHLCQVESSTTTLWAGLFPTAGCLVSFYNYFVLWKFPLVNANSANADQTPCPVASELGLHCLPIIFRVSRLKWVNVTKGR